MEKFIELLTTLGFKKDVLDKIKDGKEVDLNAEAQSFLSEKEALAQSDSTFVNGIKAQAKKEGEIVATKQFKKLLNTEFGLALTETPLAEISKEDLIKKAKEVGASSVNTDMAKLQEQVVSLTNENTQLKNDKETEVEKVKKEYDGKLKQSKIDKKLSDYIDTLADETKGKGLIVSKATALKNLKLAIQENGITDFEFDDEGNITNILKGDLPAVIPGNKGFETLETLADRSLGEFFKKSNGNGGDGGAGAGGSGGNGGNGGGGTDDDVPVEVKERIEQMKKEAGLA